MDLGAKEPAAVGGVQAVQVARLLSHANKASPREIVDTVMTPTELEPDIEYKGMTCATLCFSIYIILSLKTWTCSGHSNKPLLLL